VKRDTLRDQEFPLGRGGIDGVEPQTVAACLEACAACALACQACAAASLGESDVRAMKRMIRLDLDCADICDCTARLLARSVEFEPKLLRAMVETCARACALNGTECERHASHHSHCHACAIASRTCAERCGALLRELPDAHGETHPHGPEYDEEPDTETSPHAPEHRG
jgi:hypothetical protein